MSFSGVGGGFQGGDALLAFAAIQQGRMNEEMTESMRVADLRSQMASDLSDLKSHLEIANRHPEQFADVSKEFQAFMDKYGGEPSLEDVTSTVGEISANISGRLEVAAREYSEERPGAAIAQKGNAYIKEMTANETEGKPTIGKYEDETIKNWLGALSEKLDASGTNDQLAMIHIKQLNDNINNSSGMVSGIIESRNNATASIINNIA